MPVITRKTGGISKFDNFGFSESDMIWLTTKKVKKRSNTTPIVWGCWHDPKIHSHQRETRRRCAKWRAFEHSFSTLLCGSIVRLKYVYASHEESCCSPNGSSSVEWDPVTNVNDLQRSASASWFCFRVGRSELLNTQRLCWLTSPYLRSLIVLRMRTACFTREWGQATRSHGNNIF